ncbi:hypothetical protein AVEN_165514-1 [Araneus ventricosus]|uniref:Histone-lysine N-methyltransferase SETMAR n=1 Tax=Araneus ventricosus TaxID=182803 RepID=A0A4Y2TKK3_ARAVE|nr:hypothetical protein AVEN_165514-1 [Araneus ventricosus]
MTIAAVVLILKGEGVKLSWRSLNDYQIQTDENDLKKWATNDWFLLHDNAPPHRVLIVKKYLSRHSVTTMEHPPYSPDLAPVDFYLFPRLQMKLKGHRFVDSDEVFENAMKQLKDFSKNGFQECFEQLYERWEKCVDAGGKYFEGQ